MKRVKQRDYTIRMCIVEKDLVVLKSALAAYAQTSDRKTDVYIANDLLRLISGQEKKQDEQREANQK